MFAGKSHEAEQELPEGIPEPRNVTRASGGRGDFEAVLLRPCQERGGIQTRRGERAPLWAPGVDEVRQPHQAYAKEYSGGRGGYEVTPSSKKQYIDRPERPDYRQCKGKNEADDAAIPTHGI